MNRRRWALVGAVWVTIACLYGLEWWAMGQDSGPVLAWGSRAVFAVCNLIGASGLFRVIRYHDTG